MGDEKILFVIKPESKIDPDDLATQPGVTPDSIVVQSEWEYENPGGGILRADNLAGDHLRIEVNPERAVPASRIAELQESGTDSMIVDIDIESTAAGLAELAQSIRDMPHDVNRTVLIWIGDRWS